VELRVCELEVPGASYTAIRTPAQHMETLRYLDKCQRPANAY